MVAQMKYPAELRERAVKLYRSTRPRPVICQMARDLGVHPEALVRREALRIVGGVRPLRWAVAAA